MNDAIPDIVLLLTLDFICDLPAVARVLNAELKRRGCKMTIKTTLHNRSHEFNGNTLLATECYRNGLLHGQTTLFRYLNAFDFINTGIRLKVHDRHENITFYVTLLDHRDDDVKLYYYDGKLYNMKYSANVRCFMPLDTFYHLHGEFTYDSNCNVIKQMTNWSNNTELVTKNNRTMLILHNKKPHNWHGPARHALLNWQRRENNGVTNGNIEVINYYIYGIDLMSRVLSNGKQKYQRFNSRVRLGIVALITIFVTIITVIVYTQVIR